MRNRLCFFERTNERTKTLVDLRKEDSTENRETAAAYTKRYKNRIKHIINERVELSLL
jgi:hypothetical protein